MENSFVFLIFFWFSRQSSLSSFCLHTYLAVRILHLYHVNNKLLWSFCIPQGLHSYFYSISKMFWDTKLDILRFLRGFDYLFMSLFLRNTLIFKNISISEKKLPMPLSELFKDYPVLMIMWHKPLKCWNSQLPLLHEKLPEIYGKLIHPWMRTLLFRGK